MISRVVRDFLERRSTVLLLCSALYLVFSLLAFSLAGHDGFGTYLLLLAMLSACATAGVLYLEYRSGLLRFLLHLPVGRSALATTYWVMAVGVPTAWVFGLTVIAWLATSSGGRVGWFSVPLAVALAFLCSSFAFCFEAIENSGRKIGGESASRWARVALWALVVIPSLTGVYVFVGSFETLLYVDSRQLRHLLVVLTFGAAASTLGFARTRALLTARRAHAKSRSATPGRAIRKRLPLPRNLTGFAAVMASCLWMPVAIAGGLGAFFAIDMGVRHLRGLSVPHMDWSDTVAGAGIFTCFVVTGFGATVPRFANFRVLKDLPVSTGRLGACVTLLPAILVLIQVSLAFPLLYVLEPIAAANIFWPLAGTVGIGALLCPLLLVRPKQDIWFFAALVGIAVLESCWLTLSARVPWLQVLAPLVLAGGLFVSWTLSSLIFRHALAGYVQGPPLQWVSRGGDN